jgi:hypothetical protein
MIKRDLHIHLTITHLRHWRTNGNVFLHCTLNLRESWKQSLYTPTPAKQQNDELHIPESRRKETAQHSQHALELKHIMHFSRNGFVLDHPMPIGTTVNG